MSIFPKRSIPGSQITIHWNCNTAHLKETHITPFVRIGVVRPDGVCTMLMEQHLVIYPDTEPPPDTLEATQPRYLKKSTPLLVLAGYLAGESNKEALVDILQSIQSGRHYYFVYTVPRNAPPGRYTLLSEVHSGGCTRYSKTATDDFFFIEKISLADTVVAPEGGQTCIINHSPEPVKIKLSEYYPGEEPVRTANSFYELSGNEKRTVRFSSPYTCIIYNEEREMIPVKNNGDVFVLQNQQFSILIKQKNEIPVSYVWNRVTDETYDLEGIAKGIWEKANGLHTRHALRTPEHAEVYDELLALQLIQEI